jgi:hypothetical protein
MMMVTMVVIVMMVTLSPNGGRRNCLGRLVGKCKLQVETRYNLAELNSAGAASSQPPHNFLFSAPLSHA